MNMDNQYKSALREKFNKAGMTILAETDNQFTVESSETPDVAERKVISMMPSVGDIKSEASDTGSVVKVQFRGVSTLNE